MNEMNEVADLDAAFEDWTTTTTTAEWMPMVHDTMVGALVDSRVYYNN